MERNSREPENIDRLVSLMGTDVEAFGELYAYYQPKIYRYVVSRVGNRSDAEDITAMTFEKALRKIHTYDPNRARFYTWLYQIASNATTDHLRKSKKVKVGIEDLEEALRKDDSYNEEDVNNYLALLRLMSGIRRSYQEVLVLRYFEDLSLDEISEILGCSKSNASARLYRGLKAMGMLMEKEGVTEDFSKGGTGG